MQIFNKYSKDEFNEGIDDVIGWYGFRDVIAEISICVGGGVESSAESCGDVNPGVITSVGGGVVSGVGGDVGDEEESDYDEDVGLEVGVKVGSRDGRIIGKDVKGGLNVRIDDSAY